MNDLISRQAAIEALYQWMKKPSNSEEWQELLGVMQGMPSAQPELDEWCTDCKEYDQERHCCPRWNRVIRKTAEEVRKNAEPEPRWISISEQLPEDEEEVIVSIHDDSGDYTSSGWYAVAGDFWVVDNEANMCVTAWMPLPKPYEKEEENA